MKRLIKTIGSLLFCSIALISCSGGDSSSSGGWADAEIKDYMDNCVTPGVATKDYCSCMLEKIMDKYPNPEDAAAIDMEWVMSEVEDCLE